MNKLFLSPLTEDTRWLSSTEQAIEKAIIRLPIIDNEELSALLLWALDNHKYYDGDTGQFLEDCVREAARRLQSLELPSQ